MKMSIGYHLGKGMKNVFNKSEIIYEEGGV